MPLIHTTRYTKQKVTWHEIFSTFGFAMVLIACTYIYFLIFFWRHAHLVHSIYSKGKMLVRWTSRVKISIYISEKWIEQLNANIITSFVVFKIFFEVSPKWNNVQILICIQITSHDKLIYNIRLKIHHNILLLNDPKAR